MTNKLYPDTPMWNSAKKIITTLQSKSHLDTIVSPPYINHCWNKKVCGGAPIDSRTCKKSDNPTMGYCCDVCGEDLEGWKRSMGLIPA